MSPSQSLEDYSILTWLQYNASLTFYGITYCAQNHASIIRQFLITLLVAIIRSLWS